LDDDVRATTTTTTTTISGQRPALDDLLLKHPPPRLRSPLHRPTDRPIHGRTLLPASVPRSIDRPTDRSMGGPSSPPPFPAPSTDRPIDPWDDTPMIKAASPSNDEATNLLERPPLRLAPFRNRLRSIGPSAPPPDEETAHLERPPPPLHSPIDRDRSNTGPWTLPEPRIPSLCPWKSLLSAKVNDPPTRGSFWGRTSCGRVAPR